MSEKQEVSLVRFFRGANLLGQTILQDGKTVVEHGYLARSIYQSIVQVAIRYVWLRSKRRS